MLETITNYKNLGDWFYLVPAVLVVDFIVLIASKYPGTNPLFSKPNISLNDWYNRFGIAAVAADVLSILIGIMVARYIYTYLGLKGPWLFLLVLVLFQLCHDLFFYFFVILPIPQGHNQMIDVFKAYGKETGSNILGVDALMMIASVLIGSFLKSIPDHYTVATSFVTLYSLCYVLYTR
jgi:hypothetical protein